MLRQSRARSGITQRQLAVRAGVSQSVVAAYESDAREPSLATLAALVGDRQQTHSRPRPGLPGENSRTARGPIGHRLHRHRAAVLAVAAKHGVTDVRVFGSVARGEEQAESDLDLLVHLPDGAGLLLLGRFTQDLEDLPQVAVDVVPHDGVRRNIYRDVVRL